MVNSYFEWPIVTIFAINTPLHLIPCRPRRFIRSSLADVQAQHIGIQVQLILAVLQDLGNALCVLKLPQVDIRSRFLDGVTDQLGRAGLTLGADDGGLLLLAGLVDDEGGALCFLLGNLFGFYGGCEFGGEGEVLEVC